MLSNDEISGWRNIFTILTNDLITERFQDMAEAGIIEFVRSGDDGHWKLGLYGTILTVDEDSAIAFIAGATVLGEFIEKRLGNSQ